MDWFDLLKQPKLRVGSKVTTNIGSDKESEEKTPCNPGYITLSPGFWD